MQQRFFYLHIKKWINYRGVALLLFLAQVKNWSKIKNMNNGIEVVQVYYATPYHGLRLFMILGSCLFFNMVCLFVKIFWMSMPPPLSKTMQRACKYYIDTCTLKLDRTTGMFIWYTYILYIKLYSIMYNCNYLLLVLY